MRKVIVLAVCVFIGCTNLFAQSLVELPMKGKYIYYSFDETTNNTKKCLKEYFNSFKEQGVFNTGPHASSNILQKLQSFNKFTAEFNTIKNTMVIIPGLSSLDFGCEGEVPFSLTLMMPTGNMFFESNLLFSLITMGKFKIISQTVTANGKLKFHSANSYSLIFSNFVVKYMGMQGYSVINEVLNLEDVYAEIQKLGEQKNKMYDRGNKTLAELDVLIRKLANLISSEIIKTYEIDELD